MAPDKFKGSLSAVEATEHLDAGLSRTAPEIHASRPGV
ncbi:glycerate kinase [Modestobacter lapidis]|nr:glycerate kinase [Modestobacter lapidis]